MKEYDLLIFGATGFTGRYVVERLVKTIQKCDNLKSLRWAMAARNIDQLKKYTADIESICQTNLQHIPIHKTDISNVNSLKDVFKKSTLVLNCVGPYSLLGEPVLKSCIDYDAHYMDLSGEPMFLEKIYLNYDQVARQKGICAVGSCGFDSIPSDLGISYLKQKFPGRLNQAEHYLQLWTDGRKFNYATWRALVEGYKYRHQLKEMRKKIFSSYKSFHWPIKLERKLFRKNEFGYCVPFPGSDRSVVIRSQMHRYTYLDELPAQCECYFGLPNLKDILRLAALNYNLRLLSKFDRGEQILLDYSNIFSFGTFERNILPSREELERNKFKLTLVGKGWPEGCQKFDEQHMTQYSSVSISGGDLGYIDTAKIAIQTALVFLDMIKQNKLIYGVLTPSVAFDANEILTRMNQEGIQVDFVADYKNLSM